MSINRPATLREAYVEASSFLRRSGVLEPESNARLLLEHLLGESRTGLFLRWPEPFPREREADWQRLLSRKASGEPVQYIIGEQEFYGLPFTVTPAVLIPRPETELLVEQVVRLGRQLWGDGTVPAGEGGGLSGNRGRTAAAAEPDSACGAGQAGVAGFGSGGPRIADVGTGSGAIAVSLAVQCPGWRVTASDISLEALEVARGNSLRHGVAERVAFVEGDLLRPWIERGEPLDAVVSNPPYIPEGEEPSLQPEVRLYEPHTALFGGADGLEPYRRLTAQLGELAKLPQLVAFEVGQGQAPAVRSLLEQTAKWDEMLVVSDLAGIERHVIAYRKKS
ncbi:peptide chain release factor N(5)-glutamine methyltransferase [Paenibacillus filicis]|uniref:Release factor glutamine methyltransferase n=1 Tax=Paenibacillus gyeongsangnamensis TaxID=3388067 RepID=A0ABT4QDE3_9BACL|nr:HemK/PrmC family methyltransferase [Paenibacillus filicis]MCZ8514806.1 peptide chain release factor N(5)-glutamine methyltransferase [Paenibacillus filicis]